MVVFVKKDEDPDLSIRNRGAYVGLISDDTDKCESSHYFMRVLSYKDMEKLIDTMLFSKNRKLSREEIREKINIILT